MKVLANLTKGWHEQQQRTCSCGQEATKGLQKRRSDSETHMQQLGEIKSGEGEEPTVVKYFKHFMQQKNEWTENINSPNMNMCHRKYRSVYKKERLNI